MYLLLTGRANCQLGLRNGGAARRSHALRLAMRDMASGYPIGDEGCLHVDLSAIDRELRDTVCDFLDAQKRIMHYISITGF